MKVPEELLREVEERGLDIVDIIINAIERVDPSGGVKLRVELAVKFLNEAREYLNRGDAVQASEKAYKAVEEVVKALAEKYNLPEYQQAVKEGRWFAYLLQRASNTLSTMLGEWVAAGWASAYAVHVWGFHEGKLEVKDLTTYIKIIEDTVNKALQILSK
ncbi:MAG: PaREP1 family protein [Caldivirga sp.]|uniref:PaREP1 family protein n=1 Tax=Caldivirga sp. TaxID=2080243 RepID=UPI003D10AC13